MYKQNYSNGANTDFMWDGTESSTSLATFIIWSMLVVLVVLGVVLLAV